MSNTKNYVLLLLRMFLNHSVTDWEFFHWLTSVTDLRFWLTLSRTCLLILSFDRFIRRNHCTENHIFFFQTSWKDGLSKKNCAGIWSFLYYRERWYFFFLKIWSYPLDGKWKMIFLKKYTERWSFLQMFRKDGLFRKDCAGIWSFLYYLKRWYFFPRKHDSFSLERKWETIFPKKYVGLRCVLFTRTGVTNVAPRPSVKKNQTWSYPAKMHLKVIDVLDWHCRKSPSNSLYFHGDL